MNSVATAPIGPVTRSAEHIYYYYFYYSVKSDDIYRIRS
jgi:hypothetical protein